MNEHPKNPPDGLTPAESATVDALDARLSQEGARAAPVSRTGYLCLTDFEHELGHAQGGIEVYASLQDLRTHRACVAQCGIAQVRVELLAIPQAACYEGSESRQAGVSPQKNWRAGFEPARTRMLRELAGATVASCQCRTKTPDPAHHRADCRYRLIEEAAAALRLIPALGD